MDKITEVISRLEKCNEGSERKRITILGAGIAGLVAGYELIRLGHDVEIFEASERVGGRIRTHRFATGEYHELGAMRIPASHDFTRYYIDKMDLKTRPFITAHHNLNAFYYINGKATKIKDAKTFLFPYLRLSPSELRVASSLVAPAILGQAFNSVVNQLTWEDTESLFGNRPLTERIIELDKLSLGDYLENFLAGPDSLELIGNTTGLGVWWHKSLLMFIRDEIVGTGDGLEEIVGGTDKLTEAIAKSMLPFIHFENKVQAIHKQEKGVLLSIVDKEGQTVERVSDYVICTIPFPVLRRLDLSGLTYGKMLAIRNLNYASSAKVLLHCKERFWEKNYGIIGGASFSDQITRATYYPSDHYIPGNREGFIANPTKEVNISEGITRSSFTSFALNSPSSAGFALAELEQPGVLVGSYSWGRDAQRIGAIPENERAEVCINVISKFHPEIHQYVDDYKTVFWDEEKWSAGAFCFMLPGDLTKYYADTIKPEGRLFFAGEHCSLDQAWIQGAVISSLRAVEQILSH